MKKIITLSLSAALITSAVNALPASAETAITNTSETSIPMKLAEVKDGQFNEKGEAYFTLTIEQEGYYRLVGDKTRTLAIRHVHMKPPLRPIKHNSKTQNSKLLLSYAY